MLLSRKSGLNGTKESLFCKVCLHNGEKKCAHLKFDSLISVSQLGQKYFSYNFTCFIMHERQTGGETETKIVIIYGTLFLKPQGAYMSACMC